MSERKSRTPFGIRAAFVIYTVIMLWLLYGQRLDTYPTGGSYVDHLQYNFLPFETVVRFVGDLLSPAASSARKWTAVSNLVGNIVMFIPLGFFLPCLFTRCRRFSRCMVTVALIILGVETVQFVTLLGSFDTDDLLFNITAGAIGFALFSYASRHVEHFLGD